MGKFGSYVVMMSGLVLLFYVMGIIDQTPNSTLLKLLLSPADFQNSALSVKAIVAIELILASAIVVGFAVAGNIELGVMVSFTIFLFNTLWDFISVYSSIASYNLILGTLLFSPLIMLFVVTMLEWWRGITT